MTNMRRSVRPLAALATLALIGAGCSNGSAENGTAAASSAGDKKATDPDKAVKFAQCMRKNGVSDFPDPDAKGEFVYGVSVSAAVFTKAVKAGAPIVFATDAGVFPHGLNARQFPIMVERGMTPAQAIASATTVAAKYLGWSNDVGAIEPGKFGDLIAVRGDPLADIKTLQSVAVVIKGGVAFKLPDAR